MGGFKFLSGTNQRGNHQKNLFSDDFQKGTPNKTIRLSIDLSKEEHRKHPSITTGYHQW